MTLELKLVVDGSSVDGLKNGAREVVRHVRPSWKQDELQFKVYTDGITNQLVGVWHENRNDQLLVRIYGNKTELFIDRDAEKRNLKVLHEAGCGPSLYATFSNGVSYGYTKGVTTDTTSIVQDAVWQAICKEMAKMHKIKEGDMTKPMLFSKFRKFFNLLPDKFTDKAKEEKIVERGYTKKKLLQELSDLEDHLISLNSPIVFSHNDILLGNVIWDASAQKASFIDYEYGACNFQPYDIANHFNEFAGVEEVDYNKYPKESFQLSWLRCYLSHYKDVPESSISEQELRQWYVWVSKFSLSSHLFWGLWALLQAHHSSIDFDFLGYGIIRLDEYMKCKKERVAMVP